MTRRIKRESVFQSQFVDDLTHWVKTDRKAALRVLELVHAIVQDPFAGIGKPEPLKHEFAGCWSRRITQEHRLVYRPTEDGLLIAQCRYHY